MRRLIAACTFGAALMFGAASADTIANSVGNTLTVTTSDGAVLRYHFESNGTYALIMPDQTRVTGAWVINGNQVCLTPQGQTQQCYAYDGSKKVGDTWTMTTPEGGTLTLGITQGR
jgi:hypothetical protein